MSGNTFGALFKVTTFGEWHGKALGAVIDGCPPNLDLGEADIQAELDRRRPGAHKASTSRKEEDRVEILSGVFEGKTTGTPIALLIHNRMPTAATYEDCVISSGRARGISPTRKNTVSAITAAGAALRGARRRRGWPPAPLRGSCSHKRASR